MAYEGATQEGFDHLEYIRENIFPLLSVSALRSIERGEGGWTTGVCVDSEGRRCLIGHAVDAKSHMDDPYEKLAYMINENGPAVDDDWTLVEDTWGAFDALCASLASSPGEGAVEAGNLVAQAATAELEKRAA